MTTSDYLLTCEAVSNGHPDKIADQISDAVLDACLAQDPHSRVACECLVKDDTVILAGEVSSRARIDYQGIVTAVLRDVGYHDASYGYKIDDLKLVTLIGQQSEEIASGVSTQDPDAQGAGDQGIMYGYACNETVGLIPAPYFYAQRLMQAYAQLRRSTADLWPDAKTQLTFSYKNDQPQYIDTLVFSCQHAPTMTLEKVREKITALIHQELSEFVNADTTIHINPNGPWVMGGPAADCGLTGRKIMVDTYGGASRNGGGCFSGKDPSKVDRSAAYMARYVCKNLVASGLVERVELQVAYAIGKATPIGLDINTFGTEKISKESLLKKIHATFDFTPYRIIHRLKLLVPQYQSTACYGHFGRQDVLFPWEVVDQAAELAS